MALAYPDAEKGGRGKKSEATKSAESAGFSYRRIAQARQVLRHSRELAFEVLADTTLAVAAPKPAQRPRVPIGRQHSICR